MKEEVTNLAAKQEDLEKSLSGVAALSDLEACLQSLVILGPKRCRSMP